MLSRCGIDEMCVGDRLEFEIISQPDGRPAASDVRMIKRAGTATLRMRAEAHGWHDEPPDAA